MVKVSLQPYSPEWPTTFVHEAQRIENALAGLEVAAHHTGSTSVPGLRAKPIIDITLTVPDSTDEDAYLPLLVEAGYDFLLREPERYEVGFAPDRAEWRRLDAGIELATELGELFRSECLPIRLERVGRTTELLRVTPLA